eukprot:9587126-Heterocapsa_arctica.AAC.1
MQSPSRRSWLWKSFHWVSLPQPTLHTNYPAPNTPPGYFPVVSPRGSLWSLYIPQSLAVQLRLEDCPRWLP